VKDRKEYYAIAGSSRQELRWALDRLGPQNDEGGRSDAITKWDFGYTFGLTERASRCRVSSLETSTVITTILPRWSPGPEAQRSLVKRWDEYVECAALHENGHRRIYLDGVAELRRRASALGEFETCEAATKALDTRAQEVLRDLKEAQSAYEKRTNHGYEQCGRFP